MAFQPIQTDDQTLNRIQLEIADAFASLTRLAAIADSHPVATIVQSALDETNFAKIWGEGWVPCDGRAVNTPQWKAASNRPAVPNIPNTNGAIHYIKVR